MSKVHDAMRNLEHRSAADHAPGASLSNPSNLDNLVGALIAELADEVPDDPKLETVSADLLAASRSFETGKKKDLALRFYLAFRSLLREHELLHERLRKMEKRIHQSESTAVETAAAGEEVRTGSDSVAAAAGA